MEGCVEWTGTRMESGYGVRWRGQGRTTLVHRQAMEALLGRVLRPEETVMHVVCDNPPCYNTQHLAVGTLAENNADMASKGRARNQHSGQLECGKCGIPLGIYTSPRTGQRRSRCWPCYHEYQQADLAKRRARNAARKREATR